MPQNQFFKQMLDFNKATFQSTFNTISMMQDQAQQFSSQLLEKAPWIPQEGKKATSDLGMAFKKGRDDFKKVVDENFEKMEQFFSTEPK